MIIELKPIANDSIEFVFECLKELRGSATYTLLTFKEYVRANNLIGHPDFRILVGYDQANPIGILTCNRFSLPRYIGFGYELEEIVVHKLYQGQGYGKRMIEAFLALVVDDQLIRRVVVKTDDQVRAGMLYEKYFDVVQTTFYSKPLHYL